MPQINPIYSIIVDMLGEPGKKNHTNQQYGFNCLECSQEKGVENDGKYNLEVNLNKGLWKCWSCSEINNTHGSLKKLIKRYGTKFQLKQYNNLVEDDFNYENDKKLIKHNDIIYLPKEYISFKNSNKSNISYKEAHNYLISRGLTDDIIEKYNMGYCTEGKYKNRIIIPSYNKNNKINYFIARSYVGSKLKYLNPHIEKMNLIINEHNINWNSTIFLVEGFYDALALYPLKNIIPLIGKVMSDHLYHSLIKKSKGFICIILDNDAKIDAYKLYKRLQTTIQLKGKIRIVDLLNDADLSIIRRDFGLEGIREILKTNRRLKLDDFMLNNI